MGLRGLNVILLKAGKKPENEMLTFILSLFTMLFIVSGGILQLRSLKPLTWARFTALTSIVYYLLGYHMLRQPSWIEDFPLFSGMLALVFAALSIYALAYIFKKGPKAHDQKQALMAVYAATATVFISIALIIEVRQEFLANAFAT